MRIPDAKIEEVRAAADIVDVVSDYVRLKKSGSRYVGLCPFHSENTPSFSVEPKQNLFYCFGCLERSEPVWTGRGLQAIEDVRVGDRVLGIDGRPEVVTQKVTKRGPLVAIELEAARRDALRCTPDHTCTFVRAADAHQAVPMLYQDAQCGVRSPARRRSYCTPRPCPITEADAEQVAPGDYFLFPVVPDDAREAAPLPSSRGVRQPKAPVEASAGASASGPLAMPVRVKGPRPVVFDELPANEETARLYGLWLAEGSSYRGGVRWSFHHDETHLADFVVRALREHFGLEARRHARPARTQLEVTCSNTHLSYLFPRWFGRGAAAKRLPFQALRWPRPLQRALLRGYLDGDGRALGEQQWRAESVSEDLIRGLFALAIQAGWPVSMSRCARETTAGNLLWSLSVRRHESVTSFFHALGELEYYWMRVGAVRALEGEHTVVDLSVTGTHTFTTKLGAVHNCQQGGDIFSFVQEMESMGFLESVRLIAEQAGVPLPEEDAESRESASETEAIYHALRFAARFFYHQLTQTERGRPALDYLKGRGMTPKTIKRFGLGYAPDAWDALLGAAKAKHVAPETLEKAGLAIARNDGSGHYDRYRGRVIFPIFSHVGKVLGFAGRILSADTDQPKYINSPETKVYHKSQVLYGLSEAKQAIRKKGEVFLVEGYTDVILLSQNEQDNVVASCGTSLADGHVKILDRYADRVLLLYDPDAAGYRATIKAINMILAQGMAPYVISIPGGVDPADLLQSEDRDVTRRDFVKFRYLHAEEAGALGTPEGAAETMRGIMESIAAIPDPLMRETYLRRASEVLDVPDIRLHGVLEKILDDNRAREERRSRRSQRAPMPPAPRPDAASSEGDGEPPQRERSQPSGDAPPAEEELRAPAAPSAEPLPPEKTLLRLMLEHGAPMVELILGNMAMNEFTEGAPRDLAARLLAMYEDEAVRPQNITDGSCGEALQRLAVSVMVSRFEPSENWQRKNIKVPRLNQDARETAESAMTLLKLRRIDEAIRGVKERQFQARDDADALRQTQQRLIDLQGVRRHVERRAFLRQDE